MKSGRFICTATLTWNQPSTAIAITFWAKSRTVRLLTGSRLLRVDVRLGSRSYGDGGKGLAPLSLCETDGGAPMTQVDDLSRSLITFEQNSTMVATLAHARCTFPARQADGDIRRALAF